MRSKAAARIQGRYWDRKVIRFSGIVRDTFWKIKPMIKLLRKMPKKTQIRPFSTPNLMSKGYMIASTKRTAPPHPNNKVIFFCMSSYSVTRPTTKEIINVKIKAIPNRIVLPTYLDNTMFSFFIGKVIA